MAKRQAHRGAVVSRHCSWQYCTICGAVLLKNRASRKAWDQECSGGQRVRVQVLTSAQIRALPTWSQENAGWKW